MTTMHNLFDGSDPGLIEAERALFEAELKALDYAFSFRRSQLISSSPWDEYIDNCTGHRWAGWLAAKAQAQEEIDELRAELREAQYKSRHSTI